MRTKFTGLVRICELNGEIMSAAEYTIGRHCGVTFAGVKPASLVSIDRSEAGVIACLSDKFGAKGFCFVVLGGCQGRVLVYVYHAEQLRKLLFSCEVRMFLRSFGYEYGSVAEAIGQLKGRMSGKFPHEIGVFLGYPLSDVRGFIDDPNGCMEAFAAALKEEIVRLVKEEV